MRLLDAEGKRIKKGDWVIVRAGRSWSKMAHQVSGFWDYGDGSPQNRVEIECRRREYRPGSLLVVSEPLPPGSGERRYKCPQCQRMEKVQRGEG